MKLSPARVVALSQLQFVELTLVITVSSQFILVEISLIQELSFQILLQGVRSCQCIRLMIKRLCFSIFFHAILIYRKAVVTIVLHKIQITYVKKFKLNLHPLPHVTFCEIL